MILRSACLSVSLMFSTPTTPQDWLLYHREWRDFGSIILLIGVIAEILIDEFWEISHPPLLRGRKATGVLKTKTARLKQSAMLFAGVVLVGGGIALEWTQGTAADDVADQMRANIEEYLTPRWFMSQREYDIIGARLKPFAPQKIDLYWYPADLEANRFEMLLHDILKSSGWTVGEVRVEHPEDGSVVWYDPDGASTTKAAHTLVDVLNSQLRLSLGSPAGPLMQQVGEYKNGLVMQQPLRDGKIALVIGTLAMAREIPDWVNSEGNRT
jgi:hypothetical protein